MKRVAIKVTLEREIWLREEIWRDNFGEQLPQDMEDLDMLEDECVMTNTELKKSEVFVKWETNN